MVIPAIEEASFYEDNSEKRVGIYARVSTDDIRQTSSFELQKSHYEDMVKRYPNWHLVDIYADDAVIIRPTRKNPVVRAFSPVWSYFFSA